jgi:hypothetical protein
VSNSNAQLKSDLSRSFKFKARLKVRLKLVFPSTKFFVVVCVLFAFCFGR